MVQCSDGNIAVVLVGDHPAREYGLEERTEGMVRTYTCYIEAKEGVDFKIRTNGFTSSDRLLTKVLVDGKDAHRISVCQKVGTSIGTTYQGYMVGMNANELKYRAFTFGKMDLTSEGAAKKMQTGEMQDICTIRIEFSTQTRVGSMDHRPATTTSCELAPSSAQHEDSKPALWGISAKPGREVSTTGPVTICHCKTIDDPNALRHVVIFKYLSHDWLVAKGVKEAHLEDDGVALDSRRTERTAARRRARQEVQDWVRSSRVKREGTAMSEATTIKEEIVNRRPQMVDLTGDGDYIPAPREIGEVIVIEDDDDDE